MCAYNGLLSVGWVSGAERQSVIRYDFKIACGLPLGPEWAVTFVTDHPGPA